MVGIASGAALHLSQGTGRPCSPHNCTMLKKLFTAHPCRLGCWCRLDNFNI